MGADAVRLRGMDAVRLRGLQAHLASGLGADDLLTGARRLVEFGRDWCAAQGVRDVVAFGMAGAYAWNISDHAF